MLVRLWWLSFHFIENEWRPETTRRVVLKVLPFVFLLNLGQIRQLRRLAKLNLWMYRWGLIQFMVVAKSCVHSLKIRCCVLTNTHTLMRVFLITVVILSIGRFFCVILEPMIRWTFLTILKNFLTYNLLTIANFWMGVPSILFFFCFIKMSWNRSSLNLSKCTRCTHARVCLLHV